MKDAIDYINELKRGVNELKLMVEKKRCSKDRIKRQKKEDGTSLEGLDAKQMDEVEQSYNGNSLRSSWLQRRSKNTEVDVRIVDDEVTVKLVQQKRINCLLFASKVLDELQLDLHHVAGGLIGDYYSFLFNSKVGLIRFNLEFLILYSLFCLTLKICRFLKDQLCMQVQ